MSDQTTTVNGVKYTYKHKNTKPFNEVKDIDGRRCLRCDTVFQSFGKQNRMCNSCLTITSSYHIEETEISIPRR